MGITSCAILVQYLVQYLVLGHAALWHNNPLLFIGVCLLVPFLTQKFQTLHALHCSTWSWKGQRCGTTMPSCLPSKAPAGMGASQSSAAAAVPAAAGVRCCCRS
eukprot:scaffold137200_cov20-Tisochrysis_lutea.AAC.1